jgi:hypothetical protein
MLSVIMLSAIILSAIMLRVVFLCVIYADCHIQALCAECRYAECLC